jgi:hypothetical protein
LFGDLNYCFQFSYIHTNIPLTLYARRGGRSISDIPPRHPHFTKIILAMRNTADVTGGKPIAVLLQSISGVSKCYYSFSRLLRHPWRKERGAILLFCPGHHTRQFSTFANLKFFFLHFKAKIMHVSFFHVYNKDFTDIENSNFPLVV